jgi:hypothetical protein
VPTIQYNLTEIVAALDAKISDLQASKASVQEQINNGNRVEENMRAMDRINASLSRANSAKISLQDSCCGTQSCLYEYYS